MRYRLYIDEVGTADMRPGLKEQQRFLSLTGVIVNLTYSLETLTPRLESLKERYFGTPANDPVVMHRRDVMLGREPFSALENPAIREAFNADLMALLTDLDFTVITATIDKTEHLAKYRVWQAHPYHYCLTVIVERYVWWLRHKGTGDVMAESRGTSEDRALRNAFRRIYEGGTDQMARSEINSRLTSAELKLRKKAANVAGLQLADIVAYPSWKWMMAQRFHNQPLVGMTAVVAALLDTTKYRRSSTGKIIGYGCKWLP